MPQRFVLIYETFQIAIMLWIYRPKCEWFLEIYEMCSNKKWHKMTWLESNSGKRWYKNLWTDQWFSSSFVGNCKV